MVRPENTWAEGYQAVTKRGSAQVGGAACNDLPAAPRIQRDFRSRNALRVRTTGIASACGTEIAGGGYLVCLRDRLTLFNLCVSGSESLCARLAGVRGKVCVHYLPCLFAG